MGDPSIIVRPAEEADAPYVHSTARASVAYRMGGRFCHWPTIMSLTDAVLHESVVRVALLAGDPDIIAYIAWGKMGEIEFFHLREVLLAGGEEGRERSTRTGFASPKLVASITRALVQDYDVILRRMPSRWALQALVLAGYEPSVIPRGI